MVARGCRKEQKFRSSLKRVVGGVYGVTNVLCFPLQSALSHETLGDQKGIALVYIESAELDQASGHNSQQTRPDNHGMWQRQSRHVATITACGNFTLCHTLPAEHVLLPINESQE